MDRVTKRHDDGELYVMADKFGQALDRLAAYEDTGLDPDAVMELAESTDNRFLFWITKHYGIAAGRFLDLVHAEKEGRIVVLPCNIKDSIYIIQCDKKKRKPAEYRVEEAQIDCFTIAGPMIPMITACTKDNEWIELIDGTMAGHEYFLTREEAEVAIRKESE